MDSETTKFEIEGFKMNYFQVVYTNCFGESKVALIATNNSEPTISNWNGCEMVSFKETTFQNYKTNTII